MCVVFGGVAASHHCVYLCYFFHTRSKADRLKMMKSFRKTAFVSVDTTKKNCFIVVF